MKKLVLATLFGLGVAFGGSFHPDSIEAEYYIDEVISSKCGTPQVIDYSTCDTKTLIEKCYAMDAPKEACAAMAYRYKNDSVQTLTKKCNAKDKFACHLLGMTYHKNWTEAAARRMQKQAQHFKNKTREFTKKACDAGEPTGCSNYALVFANAKDRDKYYLKSCLLGSKNECIYGNFSGDKVSALKNACDLDNHIYACLGYAYRKNKITDNDVIERKLYFKKACELGNKMGCDEYSKFLHYEIAESGDLWSGSYLKERMKHMEYFKKECERGNFGATSAFASMVKKELHLVCWHSRRDDNWIKHHHEATKTDDIERNEIIKNSCDIFKEIVGIDHDDRTKINW